jgi:arylformamidase
MNLQHEYVEGQGRVHFPALLARYQSLSDQAAAAPGSRLDLAYGRHARQRFDHFPARAAAQGVLLYLHAGYWQSRDKALFRFIAPPLQQRGLHVVAVNYPLCPEVSLARLVEAVRPCVAAVRRDLRGQNIPVLPLVVAGHSAGAHLAVELALAGQEPGAGADAQVDGVLGISGVYDPQPLLSTTLNANLRLDAEAARAADVTSRVQPGRIPGLWVVGGAETAAFLAQNDCMHAAWQSQQPWSRRLVVPNADHFTVLQSWVDGHGGWDAAVAAWWNAVRTQQASSAG